MAPHYGDEGKLIAIAKQGRAQLEESWARERSQRQPSAQLLDKPVPAQLEPGGQHAQVDEAIKQAR
jgi:hypothetical protein